MKNLWKKKVIPTNTPRRIQVNSTSIIHRYVEDQISTNFRVISTYFFDVISLIEKSTSFPRTFFDVISMAEKSTLFPHTFFHVISLVEISTLFLLTFFEAILMGKNSTSFLVTCKQMKTLEEVSCVCNFKQLTFTRLFSLHFSSKSPWYSVVPLKFESYNLHHCKKNCHKLVFSVFTKELLYQIIFERLHRYKVTLVKKCNKPLLQKSET